MPSEKFIDSHNYASPNKLKFIDEGKFSERLKSSSSKILHQQSRANSKTEVKRGKIKSLVSRPGTRLQKRIHERIPKLEVKRAGKSERTTCYTI